MKRIRNLIVAAIMLLTLTACSGNFEQVNLKEPIEISEDGIVEKSVLNQIKEDKAIVTFIGTSGGMEYEWTVFGSDLSETKDVNLAIDLEATDAGLELGFLGKEELGFPALLSIHLNEKWIADSATAYRDEKPVYSVSITGSKNSILNLSVGTMIDRCTILPDENRYAENISTEKQEVNFAQKAEDAKDASSEAVQGEQGNFAVSNQGDDYLSAVQQEENKVYKGYSQGDISGESNQQKDEYLSGSKQDGDRVYSDGSATDQDKYQTDPVPEGKPMPVEPENQEINNQKTYTCTFSIECSTILNNLQDLDPDKRELVPSNGVILAPVMVTFYEGESVFDVLKRVCRENNIHMESSWTPVYNSAYVEGIHNLYEFDCGSLSGWMYRVNGWYPNYGCSRYQLTDGENVEWRYTCDLGKDVGCDWMQ